MAQAGGNFNAPYMFKQNNTVVIQNKGGGEFSKFLRVKGGDEGTLDPSGGKGNLAQWAVELIDGGSKIKLKSTKSGKYLRIFGDDNKIDVNGGGGKWTVFKVHQQGKAGGGMAVKLESNEKDGKYLAVKKNNNVAIGNGGPWTELRFFRNAPKAEPFTKPYLFGKTNTIVIKHKMGKFLRVKPNEENKLDQDGGKGAFAQWEAEPIDGGKFVKIKSEKSGKYLRIGPQGNINVGGGGGKFTVFKVHKISQGKAKLESKEHDNKYIAVQKQNGIAVGNGGQWTELEFYRKN